MTRPGGEHVLVLAKAPVPGLVKTRLQPTLTPHEAAAVAEAALADTLAVVAACGARRRVLALAGDPGPWIPPGFEIVPQCAGSLGRRLAHAWAAAGGPGIQIGMDTPHADAATLDAALAVTLDSGAGAALGMAADGGWWAIGFAGRAPATAFHGVPMSTPDTGRRQRLRLEALGLTVAALPTLRDIDTPADLIAVAATMPAGSATAAIASVLAARLGRAA